MKPSALVRALAGERARIVINDERLGLAGNWNQCMALSQTPWVNIFHQDDVMLPGHLSWVLERLEVGRAESRSGRLDRWSRACDRREVSAGRPLGRRSCGGRLGRECHAHSVDVFDFPPGELCDLAVRVEPVFAARR